MNTISDIYREILSKDNPLQAFSFLAIESIFLIYTAAFAVRTHFFGSLDRVSVKMKYPTVGCKTVISLIGLFCGPMVVPSEDWIFLESAWNNSSIVCLALLVGACIVFKPKKERACVESVRHAIFFQSLGTMASPLMRVNFLLGAYGSIVLLLVYTVHTVILIQRADSTQASTECIESRKNSLFKRVLDLVVCSAKEECSPNLGMFVSPVVMGSVICCTFLSLCIKSLFLSVSALFALCAFVRHTKKTSIFRCAYTLACICVLLRCASEHLYLAFSCAFPEIKVHPFVRLSLATARLMLPTSVVIAVGIWMGKYMQCLSIGLSLPIHYMFFQRSIFNLAMKNQNSIPLVNRTSPCTLIFTVISTMLIFLNNEVRTGLFEVEVGALLILLYFIYFTCLVFCPIPRAAPS
ncbi:uncharacterized protein NEMAJ01_0578 [Nematocida major]|uniref:uncharacterized protein n=1 Tax=Nematocida major TaxID=1912982 RepID=UPI0020074B1E|nr:uncharacterized protein NEMAJ01_0578 [Nematocida major]KAH9385682.1 hypothetical protein NEMAJ01_0578 [Nematocida major]